MKMMNKKRASYTKKVLKNNDLINNNEIKMSDSIKKIKNYELYFKPIKNFKLMSLFELQDISKDLYFLNEYEYLDNEKYIFFNDYFNKPVLSKKYILNIITSYKYLLNSILILDENRIINLDLYPKNIIFVDEKKSIITNFGRSFINSSEKIENIDFLLKEYNASNIYIPLEAQLICYMNEMKIQSLSYENIELVINEFNRNMSLSSISYILNEDKYLSLINKPRNFIISSLLMTSNTWNNYGLSILYLQILSILMKDYSKDNKEFINFIKGFYNILLLGLERVKIDNIIELFDKMILSINEKEWNMIFTN